jgi:hypothetical protein
MAIWITLKKGLKCETAAVCKAFSVRRVFLYLSIRKRAFACVTDLNERKLSRRRFDWLNVLFVSGCRR